MTNRSSAKWCYFYDGAKIPLLIRVLSSLGRRIVMSTQPTTGRKYVMHIDWTAVKSLQKRGDFEAMLCLRALAGSTPSASNKSSCTELFVLRSVGVGMVDL